MNTLLRLVRFSLAPTLLADLAAGTAIVIGSARFPFPGPLRALPGLLLLFLGGMAWNAWIDRKEDAQNRPDRPLPRGEVSAASVFLVALGCFVGAPFAGLAFGGAERMSMAIWFGGMAVLILLYHSPVRRSVVLGPLVLGSIRMASLLSGAVLMVGLEPELRGVIAIGALYGAYVVGASMVAHLEDRDAGRAWLRTGVLMSLGAIAITAGWAWSGDRTGPVLQLAATAVAIWHGIPLLRGLRSLPTTNAEVEALARVLLGRMPLLTTALCLASGSAVAAVIALVAFQVVRALVKVIPPT